MTIFGIGCCLLVLYVVASILVWKLFGCSWFGTNVINITKDSIGCGCALLPGGLHQQRGVLWSAAVGAGPPPPPAPQIRTVACFGGGANTKRSGDTGHPNVAGAQGRS